MGRGGTPRAALAKQITVFFLPAAVIFLHVLFVVDFVSLDDRRDSRGQILARRKRNLVGFWFLMKSEQTRKFRLVLSEFYSS